MPSVDWRFPAYLFGAMLLGLLMAYIQMRAYNREVNRALQLARGEHLMLVSGRGRSWRGGAIVIAIVDIVTREIIWARAMTGVTVFARFGDLPVLIGPITGALDRVPGKQLKAAVEMAMAQVRPGPIDPQTEAAAGEPTSTTTTGRGLAGAQAPGRRLVRKRVPPTP